ncbi:MAG: NADPH:quinone oxidoreductase family protein [Aquisalinus sp.]|nr:NADPH:quinone oxidoreductase family protein [Aquisalinus sp.]
MKALMSVAPGGPETLELQEMPTPQPGKGEVLIAIKAASVNFPDTLVIRDLYQFKPERPFAPGSEVAGVVEAVGDGVSNLKAGDNVFALLNSSGGFATHTVIDAMRCVPLPGGMPHEEAAAFMMTYGTSHYALKDRGNLQAGESLFITGASGGVGSAAIELGKAAGARVIAGVSSEEKAAFCKEIGADETIIYPTDLDKDGQRALSKEIKAKAGGEGVNVVYDAVGGAYAEPCVRALAWEGRFLVIGFPAGIPAVPLNLTLLKSCQIVGVFWGASVMRDPQGHAANMKELFGLYQSGKIRPRITERFNLEDGARALQLLEERKATGKVVLTME